MYWKYRVYQDATQKPPKISQLQRAIFKFIVILIFWIASVISEESVKLSLLAGELLNLTKTGLLFLGPPLLCPIISWLFKDSTWCSEILVNLGSESICKPGSTLSLIMWASPVAVCLRQYLWWYLLEIRLTTPICVVCCKSPSRFQNTIFFCLLLTSAGFALSEEWEWVILLKKDACVLLAAVLFLPYWGTSAGACIASPLRPWQPGLMPPFRAGSCLSELHRRECSGLEVWKSVKYRADNWEFRNLSNSHNSHWESSIDFNGRCVFSAVFTALHDISKCLALRGYMLCCV